MSGATADTPDPDGTLVERTLSGDDGAFGHLVARHTPALWRYARTMVHDDDDASELVQDTFWRAYRSLPSYRHGGHFDRWLRAIATNLERNLRRRARRELRRMLAAFEPAVTPTHPAGDAGDIELVGKYLLQLDAPTREALILRFGEELGYAEMAARTGVAAATLRMRVHRGISRLRDLLRPGKP